MAADYLVCCDHFRQVVPAHDVISARCMAACKTCVDIRVYLATEEDKRLVRGPLQKDVKKRFKATDQQDWVTQ